MSGAGGPPGAPRSRADAGFRLLLLAVYVALIFYGGIHHAMWRDEAQAWLIARDADGLGQLFANLRYDGHPALWHALLFVLTRLGDDPNLMLALNFVVMATMAALVLWFMPLRAWERILFPFGYFMLFEYGVKARSYGLGGLLLVLLCLAWPARGRRSWLIALLLVLLANTHVLFMIATIAIVCALAVESLARRPGAMPASAPTLAALALVGAGWALALWTFVPPPDTGYAVEWFLEPAVDRLALVLGALQSAMGNRPGVPLWLAGAVMLATLWSIRRTPAAATWLLLSVVGMLGFGYVKLPGYAWHHGVIFLAWLGAVWVARLETPLRSSAADRAVLTASVTVLLATQAYYGLSVYRHELHRPYSNGRAVASYLRSQGWDRDTIAALPDFAAAPVIAYLGADHFYFLNGRRNGSFTVWDQRRNADDLGAALDDLDRTGGAVVLVVHVPDDDPAAFLRHGYREVGRFMGARTENYVLYRRSRG